MAVSLNNIDLVIVLSLHNFCRNGHGDSGNYQVPSYQGNRLLPNAHIATVVARLAAPRAPCRCGWSSSTLASQLRQERQGFPYTVHLRLAGRVLIRRDLDCTLYCLKYFSFYLGTNLSKIESNCNCNCKIESAWKYDIFWPVLQSEGRSYINEFYQWRFTSDV